MNRVKRVAAGGAVKKIVMAIAAMGLMLALAGAVRAQVYGYPYSYGAYPPDDPYVAYDPYYELHLIHYQLYLGSYGYYPYPYFVPFAPVIAVPPAVAARRPLRTTAPTARKR
jgi:hypothetical protein